MMCFTFTTENMKLFLLLKEKPKMHPLKYASVYRTPQIKTFLRNLATHWAFKLTVQHMITAI